MSTVDNGTLAAIIISSVIFSLVAIIFAVVIYWKIFSKAGYSGAMSLLMFVPIANIVVLCILAFGEWPIYKELNYLRQQVARGQQYPSSPPQFPSSPQYPRS
jgi:heme/copper-type cytochrome/quinol oxidase subunit 2